MENKIVYFGSFCSKASFLLEIGKKSEEMSLVREERDIPFTF